MRFDPHKHHRRSVRLHGYDYTQEGAYFVTICTQGRECLFGEAVDGRVDLSLYGEVVHSCWNDLPHHYRNVELNAFVVMPNHVHGIIVLTDPSDSSQVGAGLRPAPTTVGKPHTLSEIIRAFKSFSSRRINQLRHLPGIPVWQRNYYEHVICNESELHNLHQYIADNPLKWEFDRENPASPGEIAYPREEADR